MKREEKKFIDSVMYMFKAPYITWPDYEGYITPDMKQRAELERFKNITEIMETKEATDYEVVIYLHDNGSRCVFNNSFLTSIILYS